MIDDKLRPYLLEVNASPSFSTDSPLDYKVKKNVTLDALSLLNFSEKKRKRIIKQKKKDTKHRILTGKTRKLSYDEREVL